MAAWPYGLETAERINVWQLKDFHIGRHVQLRTSIEIEEPLGVVVEEQHDVVLYSYADKALNEFVEVACA